MKYCTKCGTQVSDDSKFCTKCGNKLNGEPAESPSKSKKSTLIGVGAVLAVAVVALVVVLSKGKGSGSPDIASSSSNVSTEKESGGTEKSGGFFDGGSDKKWEKEYVERLDAYLEYYEEHVKDSEKVLGYVLINEDKLPYMVLNYGDGIDQEYVRNYISIVDYIDNTVKVVAEKQFDGVDVSPYLFDSVCFLSFSVDNGYGYDKIFFKLEDGNLVKVDGNEPLTLFGGYYITDKFYYNITSGLYEYIGRETLKDYTEDAIYSGRREASDVDFLVVGSPSNKDDMEIVFQRDSFYIGSEQVSILDFKDKLTSYNMSDEDANVEYGGLQLGIGNFRFYDASFRNLLRALKEKPAGSVENLVGFYLKFVNSEYGDSGYSSKLKNSGINSDAWIDYTERLVEDQSVYVDILKEKIKDYEPPKDVNDESLSDDAGADAAGADAAEVGVNADDE